MNPGDVLLLFADGISEAGNERKDAPGTGRIIKTVAKDQHLCTEDLRDALVEVPKAI